MKTIVIGVGLAKGFLSSDRSFRDASTNVGPAEIGRLLGRGRSYGAGPLPSFLRQARDGADGGAAIRTILLNSTGQGTGKEADASAGFHEVLEEIAADATVIASPGNEIPWQDLLAACGHPEGAEGASGTRFVVVGCHTEQLVYAVASFLRSVLGFPNVAVSPQLVGSATQEAHFATLRHNLPLSGVEVFLDLEELAEHAGLGNAEFDASISRPCSIEPQETRDALVGPQKRILELLCMHWTRANLRPLAGGFSGSLLLLANGWKGDAKTEPMVVKVDKFSQMRRELDGYHQVKDFCGKHVPTFGYPVMSEGDIGVSMELAAMEGSPRTLQDSFECAEDQAALGRFLIRLEKMLALLSEKLYGNTKELTWVAPYREFGLHAEEQVTWLVQNADVALSYLGSDVPGDLRPKPAKLAKLLRVIAANPDGMDSAVCLAHGDLNFANVICDEGDNVWFIDWTHCGRAPVELDFAKLECDAKFVMSKEFDVQDLSRLKMFEEYLLSQRIPGDVSSLPDHLKYVKWDLRFQRILETVTRVRRACFELMDTEGWLVYRVALLRYALHTLSFDQRRDRGECCPSQLMHALYSVEALVFDLVGDDFHLKIRSECPSSYPARQRISIDEAPWMFDCDAYDPPHFVHPSVLENGRSNGGQGWADPEDHSIVRDEPRVVAAKFKDDSGRPLNPRGRTGIAGRGELGLWGRNLAVASVVTRTNPDGDYLDILLGGQENRKDLALPKGFVLPDEAAEVALARVLEQETGLTSVANAGEAVFEGYTYDPRQTDNAWVESRAYLVQLEGDALPSTFTPGGDFDEVKWWPLEAGTINRLPPGQARFLRECVAKLVESEQMETSQGEELLAATG